MSPLESWLAVLAVLFLVGAAVVLLGLLVEPHEPVELAAELRGPEPDESLWRYAPHIAIVIGAFLLAGTLDYQELAHDGRTAYAAKE